MVARETKKTFHTGYIFLMVMGMAYAVSGWISPRYTLHALSQTVEMLKHIVPILLFVYAMMFLINVFVDPQTIQNHLGQDSGVRGWLYTLIGAVIFTGPPYVLFPLLGELKKNGMKHSLIVAFLYNRNVQLPFLPVMIYYFGWRYTIVLSCFVLIFSILSGLVLEKWLRAS